MPVITMKTQKENRKIKKIVAINKIINKARLFEIN